MAEKCFDMVYQKTLGGENFRVTDDFINEGWCAMCNAINEGWCEMCNALDEGWCDTLHQTTIDCNEGWCDHQRKLSSKDEGSGAMCVGAL